MTTRQIALGLIVAAVFVTGSQCSPKELAALKGALRSQDSVSGELLVNARAVKKLSGLSAEDLALQRQLLTQADERILTSAAVAMDATASSARSTADAAAEVTASGVVIRPVQPKFTQDLKEVTKELVKEQACQAVLDQVAPAPEEPGERQTWTDMVSEVVDRMVARQWNPPTDQWVQFVAWEKYATGVAEDADQLTQALLADPSAIELFARPPVQRAALAYARFCYKPPRLP